MRIPIKKNLNDILVEGAHEGSGRRQLILSKDDPISKHMHAMTKGYLPKNAIFDWHKHEKIDKFFLVLKGSGIIRFRDGKEIKYKKDDLIYIPAELEHRIENTDSEENEFFFIRLDE